MKKGTILGDTFEQLAELGVSSAKKTVKSVAQIVNPFSKNESHESNESNKPNLTYMSYLTNREIFANLMVTLCFKEGYLLDQLVRSQQEKFVKTGGFRENLFKKRTEYKKRFF